VAFAYVERLLEHHERVGDALNTLEELQRTIVSKGLYPDPEEYYEPLRSLIGSIGPYATGRMLTPELLLQTFQSDGAIVTTCIWRTSQFTLQNQTGSCFSSGC
jgi:ubiquitin thioesterase protein OTUB1